MNTYLIAYTAPNDRVLSKRVGADSQAKAIRIFELYNPCSTIIAVTLLEEKLTHQHEDKGE